jgi:hypothetical protein
LSERKRETDEDDAIDGDSPPQQNVRDARRACDAVAFTREIERRVPGLESVPIDADELGDRLGVAACLIELRAVFRLRGTAVARTDRVNEHEVRLIEPRALIVNRRAIGLETARSKSQQMHE